MTGSSKGQSWRGTTAIVGVATAGCGETPGRAENDLAAHAALAAIADAGLKLADIDGLITASVTQFMPALGLAEHLGIQPAFSDSTGIGGSSFVAHLLHASLALNAGLCNAV